VTTAGGTRLTADLVLVGIGGVPSDQFARDAQLSCTNGIVVDDHGMTSDPDIYAAGDCANHYNAMPVIGCGSNPFRTRRIRPRRPGWLLREDRTLRQRAAFLVRPVRRQTADRRHLAQFRPAGDTRLAGKRAVSVFYYSRQACAVDSINRAGDQMAARRLIGTGVSPSPEQAADPSFDFKSLLTPIKTKEA
jgi:hypothetical protein